MNQTKHRLGVSEATLVRRKLKLDLPGKSAAEAAVSEIDQIFGMDAVSFDPRTSVLSVAYDATRTCLECVEEVLARHGITVNSGWWMRLKQNFYHFTDDNVKENANHEPWSCH